MRKARKLLFLVLSLCLFLAFTGCADNQGQNPDDNQQTEKIDYVSQVKLEQNFEGKTMAVDGVEEVTLYQAVDGDTIHVYSQTGAILKLRFLGVDTPESTAQVEAWGVAASNFTKNIVKTCTSIVITSNGGPGEKDSYDRYLSWVWYKPADGSDYKLLNLELVQEGYSKSKNTAGMLYYDTFVACADQARKQGIKVWGEKDPNYSYSEVLEVSLPEIKRSLIEKGSESPYYLKKVVFYATVARYFGSTYYLIDEDLEEGITYGIQVFHRNSTGTLDKVGARVRISGTISYYETGDVYQLTDVVDRLMTSNINNLKIVEEVEVTPAEIQASDLDVNNKTLDYNLVSIKNLVVKSTYTTTTEGSSSKGAITITCEVDGQEVVIRTEVIYDRTGTYEVDSNSIVLASNFEGKTLDVTGVIEKYQGNYQIMLLSMNDVVIR
jgi:micrococcal nuclease